MAQQVSTPNGTRRFFGYGGVMKTTLEHVHGIPQVALLTSSPQTGAVYAVSATPALPFPFENEETFGVFEKFLSPLREEA